MTAFAKGKHAIALCDRCGFQYGYTELRVEVVRRRPTGMRVCPDCFDVDHPQNMQGMTPINDPQALRHPRPARKEPTPTQEYEVPVVPPVTNNATPDYEWDALPPLVTLEVIEAWPPEE